MYCQKGWSFMCLCFYCMPYAEQCFYVLCRTVFFCVWLNFYLMKTAPCNFLNPALLYTRFSYEEVPTDGYLYYFASVYFIWLSWIFCSLWLWLSVCIFDVAFLLTWILNITITEVSFFILALVPLRMPYVNYSHSLMSLLENKDRWRTVCPRLLFTLYCTVMIIFHSKVNDKMGLYLYYIWFFLHDMKTSYQCAQKDTALTIAMFADGFLLFWVHIQGMENPISYLFWCMHCVYFSLCFFYW